MLSIFCAESIITVIFYFKYFCGVAPPLNLILEWTHQAVTEGDSISVRCVATGASPRPHGFVYWTNGTSPWEPRLGEFTSDEESSASMLKMGSVSRRAAGLYTCWANNSIEPGAMFKNFLLEVLCKISLDEELLKAIYLNCLTVSYVII